MDTNEVLEYFDIIVPQHKQNKPSTGWWTVEREQRLTVAWNGGQMSASTIAADMKTSRSAIIGKAHRLHLCAKARPLGPRKPKVPREAKARKVIPFRKWLARPELPIAQHPPANPPAVLDALACQGEAPYRECHYIVGRQPADDGGNALYCAAPKTDYSESYCVFHWRLCYNLDAPKRNISVYR